MGERTAVITPQSGRVYSEQQFDLFLAQLIEDPTQRAMARELGHDASREYFTSQPTYPGGGNIVSVDNALRFPVMIARAVAELAYQRFVADKILARGSSEQVASGAVIYQRTGSIFMERNPEEVAPRSRWPRSGFLPGDWFAALAKKAGLEVPIADEARRRNAVDVLASSQRRLANSVVRYVDQQAMSMILTDTAVNTYAAALVWSNASADKIADIANARGLINNKDLGYEADTLIIHPNQELQLLTDKNIRDALPRETTGGNPLQNSILSGRAVPLLGLRQILVTNQLTAGTAIMCNAGVVGSIADEQPGAFENYTGYDPGAGQMPVFIKMYREEGRDETIVRGARFPAMWMGEPQAATVITGL